MLRGSFSNFIFAIIAQSNAQRKPSNYLKFHLFLVLFGARFEEKHDRAFD